MKTEIYRNYPHGNKVELVERLLDRGLVADATRSISRNRQPGRCCVTGCQMTDLPFTKTVSQPKPRAVALRPEPQPAAADHPTR
jgi:4-hydroxybutyryl-CoA dehydratase/vinylacetyl-CoA-Delta-isomerase